MVRLPKTPRTVLALLSGSVFALAGCDDATRPLPREGVPDELSLSIGGFGAGSSRVQLHGDTLVLLRTPWDWSPGAAVDSVRVVPAPGDWGAFWEAVERAGVGRWTRSYRAEGVMDGSGWSLRIVAGERTVVAGGSNAYPDREGRESELEMTPAFQEFLTALETLLGERLWPVLGPAPDPAAG